ncbi:MAG: DUF4391 domain-containing protein [Thermodesulfobacteriota bacterium]|nr:DUF4391 domain-containing protein [Thermodesulfobacteriota bacterium]
MNKAMADLWETFRFPETALLARRVPKKQFLDSGQVMAGDKKLFRKQVKNIHWQYTLKPFTCPVLPYRDAKREYPEIAVLQIELTAPKGHRRIAEVIHRVIPYPLFLVFAVDPDRLALSIAPKRFSQAEQGAFVAERFFTTNWMEITHLKEPESAFIHSLAWDHLPLTHYEAVYNTWLDRFTGYACARFSGSFTTDRLKKEWRGWHGAGRLSLKYLSCGGN